MKKYMIYRRTLSGLNGNLVEWHIAGTHDGESEEDALEQFALDGSQYHPERPEHERFARLRDFCSKANVAPDFDSFCAHHGISREDYKLVELK